MSDSDVAVVMHIDENLSDAEIQHLEHELSDCQGIRAACVAETARHLMVIDYDPQEVYSGAILDTVQDQGYHAELIGF